MQGLEARFQDAYSKIRWATHQPLKLDDEMVLFSYRQAVRQELSRRFDGKFWISPDIAVAKNVLIKPNGIAHVPVVIPASLKPFTDFHPYAFSCANASTRSRFALTGLEVHEGAGRSIGETIIPRDEDDLSKGYNAFVVVQNMAERAHFLSEGKRFFYLYYWNGEVIKGKELKDLIGSKIKISGKEGEDYRFWKPPFSNGEEKDTEGIEFFLDEESEAWIPYNPKPITINDGPVSNHNRDEVDTYYEKPVPENLGRRVLWFAETRSDIELDTSVNGLVDMCVSHNGLPVGSDDNNDFQTNSLVIKGGNTYRKTRAEIRSFTDKEGKPKTILMRFAHSEK